MKTKKKLQLNTSHKLPTFGFLALVFVFGFVHNAEAVSVGASHYHVTCAPNVTSSYNGFALLRPIFIEDGGTYTNLSQEFSNYQSGINDALECTFALGWNRSTYYPQTSTLEVTYDNSTYFCGLFKGTMGSSTQIYGTNLYGASQDGNCGIGTYVAPNTISVGQTEDLENNTQYFFATWPAVIIGTSTYTITSSNPYWDGFTSLGYPASSSYATMEWNTGYVDNDEFVLWQLPTDNLTTPEPDTFYLSFGGLQTNTTYYGRISAYNIDNASGTALLGDQVQWFTFSNNSSTSKVLPVPRTIELDPSPHDVRHFLLYADLCYDSFCINQVANSGIEVWINFYANLPDNPWTSNTTWQSTSSFLYDQSGNKLPNDIREQREAYGDCGQPPDSWGGGIWYGFCRLGNFFFSPHDYAKDFLNDSLVQIKSLKPFSYLFDVVSLGQSTAMAIASSTDDVSMEIDFNDYFGTSTGRSITLLTTSTLSNIISSSTKNDLFTVQDYIFKAVTIGIVIATLF